MDIDEKPKESNFLREYKFLNLKNKEKNIVHYSHSDSNSIGVYTIYDKEFDENKIKDILNFDIIITDDIDKLLNFF